VTWPDSVVVPCIPTSKMATEGARALDLWSDDALRETIDGTEMARRVYAAMTSAAPSNEKEAGTNG
jgi:hypothetical protein